MTEILTQEQFVPNNSLTANTTLRKDAHKAMAVKLVEIAHEQLVGVQDLIDRGLTINIPTWGITLFEYEKSSGMTDAEVNMDGSTKGQNDRVTFESVAVPIPVVAMDWTIGARQLAASTYNGTALDTTQLALSARNVYDKMEDILFNGLSTLIVSGAQIYGYTNHPNRNTVSFAGSGWATATGRDIIGDTKKLLQAMYNDNRYGPFVMYVAKNVWAELQMDYSTSKGDRTFRERILAFNEIIDVKCSGKLASGNVVLVQLTDDVVQLAVAKDISYKQYSNDGFTVMFKTFMAAAPVLKSDKDGSCGIAHGS